MAVRFDLEEMRARLRSVVDASELSLSTISEKAGVSSSYLAGLLNSGRDPQTEKLISICNAIDVSPTWVLWGFEMPQYGDEVLQAMADQPDLVPAVVALLRSRKRGAPQD